jgi:hypothetical protein
MARFGIITGTSSSLNRFSREARKARWWESRANVSWSARLMENSVTRFSAVCPMIWPQTGSVSPSQIVSIISE